MTKRYDKIRREEPNLSLQLCFFHEKKDFSPKARASSKRALSLRDTLSQDGGSRAIDIVTARANQNIVLSARDHAIPQFNDTKINMDISRMRPL